MPLAGGADEMECAIGIGTRDDEHVDAVEPHRAVSALKFRGERERRFAAGGLVAVLLPDDQHRSACRFSSTSPPNAADGRAKQATESPGFPANGRRCARAGRRARPASSSTNAISSS